MVLFQWTNYSLWVLLILFPAMLFLLLLFPLAVQLSGSHLNWLIKKGEKAKAEQKSPKTPATLEQPVAGLPDPDGGKPSGELEQWITALTETEENLERHRLLQLIVEFTYKNRKQANVRELFYTHAHLYIKELSGIMPMKEFQTREGSKKNATFTYLAVALEEDGAFQDAIQVCREAIWLGIDDGTRSGFQGRAVTLQKKWRKKK